METRLRSVVAMIMFTATMLLVACARRNPLDEAKALIGKLDYLGARRITQRVVAANTMNSEAMAFLLRVHFLSRDTVAFDTLRRVLKASESPIAKLALGEFYFHLSYFDSAVIQFAQISSQGTYSKNAGEWLELSLKGVWGQQLVAFVSQFNDQGNFDVTVAFADRADRIWQELDHAGARSFTLAIRAYAHKQLGNNENADRDVKESLQLAQQAGDRHLLANAWLAFGRIEVFSDNWQIALEDFQKAEKFAQVDIQRSRKIYLRAFTNTATPVSVMGDPQKGKEILLQALSLTEKWHDDQSRITVLHNIGRLCLITNERSDARRYYEEAMKLSSQLGYKLEYAAALQGKGFVHQADGEYEKAVNCVLGSNAIFHEIGSKVFEARGILFLAQLYMYMGRYDDASRVAQEGVAAAEATKNKGLIARAYGAIARNYEDQKIYGQALKSYESVLRVARELQDFELMAFAVTAITRCSRFTEGSPSLVSELEAFITEADKRGFIYRAEDARVSLAKVHIARNEFLSAIKLLNKVLSSAKSIEEFGITLEVYESLADAYRGLGENEKAVGFYTTATDLYERAVNSMSFGADRVSYFDKFRYCTENQIALEYDRKRYPEVFELAERAKARTFLGLLSNRELGKVNQVDSADIAEAKRLRDDVSRLYSEIKESTPTEPNATRGLVDEKLSNDYDAAQAKLSAYLLEMERRNSRASSLLHVPTVRLEDIQKILSPTSLLLEYVVLDDKLLVCALNHVGNLKVFSLARSRRDLRSSVRSFVDYLRVPESNKDILQESAVDLGAVLLDSVGASGLFTNVNTLIVLADDCLHQLPFQALRVNGQPVIERFAVINYPSASIMSILHKTQKRFLNHEKVLAIAYSDGSIPFAEKETRSIKALFGNSASILSQKNASREIVLKSIHQFDVLHFATHGVTTSEDPLLFALQLAPSVNDDGRLFVHDVFGLNLTDRNPLVVMSACESGVGGRYALGISTGGEVFGLHRAFIYAGASAVVSTLWKVHDEGSAVFMDIFYRELKGTQNAAVALQRTQQLMLANPKFSHPFFWSPYILTGM